MRCRLLLFPPWSCAAHPSQRRHSLHQAQVPNLDLPQLLLPVHLAGHFLHGSVPPRCLVSVGHLPQTLSTIYLELRSILIMLMNFIDMVSEGWLGFLSFCHQERLYMELYEHIYFFNWRIMFCKYAVLFPAQ